MGQNISAFLKNFCKCGLAGWCIYGCAALFSPLGLLLRKKPLWARGTAYMSLIFSLEYAAGKLLASRKSCPWDYGRSRWNIGRVIRLDFAPCWFAAGLLFERLLSSGSFRDQNLPPS